VKSIPFVLRLMRAAAYHRHPPMWQWPFGGRMTFAMSSPAKGAPAIVARVSAATCGNPGYY
jgi:hypothetical protein